MNYFNYSNNSFNWTSLGDPKTAPSASMLNGIEGGAIKIKDNFKPKGDLFKISFSKNGKGAAKPKNNIKFII